MLNLQKIFIPNVTFDESQWVEEQKYRTLYLILVITVLILTFFVILRLYFNDLQMVKINLIGATVFAVTAMILRTKENTYNTISRIFILTTFSMASVNMNLAEGASRAIWLAPIIIATFYFRDKKEGLVWTGLFVLFLFFTHFTFSFEVSHLGLVDYATLAINFILIAVILSWYEKIKAKEKERLLKHNDVLEQMVQARTKELENQVITDQLTSLYNRRHLYDVADRVLKSCIRDKIKFALIMVDIDNFKKYNDNYGHQKGDLVLKSIGNLLLSQLNRGSDYAFRIGGEEFLILLQEENGEKVFNYIEKIREKIQSLNIEHIHNDPYTCVTASFGIEFCQPNIHTEFDELYKKADEKLYLAKDGGKNKTVL